MGRLGPSAIFALGLLASMPAAMANNPDDLAREQAQPACAAGNLPGLFVAVEFNQSQDDRWRADWTELTRPILEGAEDAGQPTPTGQSGYLLFFPDNDCWTMVEDHRDGVR